MQNLRLAVEKTLISQWWKIIMFRRMGGVKEGNLEYWLCRKQSICKVCLEKEKPAFVIKSLLISKEHRKLYRQNPSLRGKLLDSIRIALLIKSQAAIAGGNNSSQLRGRFVCFRNNQKSSVALVGSWQPIILAFYLKKRFAEYEFRIK